MTSSGFLGLSIECLRVKDPISDLEIVLTKCLLRSRICASLLSIACLSYQISSRGEPFYLVSENRISQPLKIRRYRILAEREEKNENQKAGIVSCRDWVDLHRKSHVRKKLISINDAMKKYEGVWINEEYTGEKVTQPQKFVITADGGVEDWALATQASPTFRGNHKVVESWIDRRRLHLLHS
jgi:hypothetical protein